MNAVLDTGMMLVNFEELVEDLGDFCIEKPEGSSKYNISIPEDPENHPEDGTQGKGGGKGPEQSNAEEEYIMVNGKRVAFLVGERTWPQTGGRASVFDLALTSLKNVVSLDGTKRTIGAARALMESPKGFPIDPSTSTLVRFADQTRSYSGGNNHPLITVMAIY